MQTDEDLDTLSIPLTKTNRDRSVSSAKERVSRFCVIEDPYLPHASLFNSACLDGKGT